MADAIRFTACLSAAALLALCLSASVRPAPPRRMVAALVRPSLN